MVRSRSRLVSTADLRMMFGAARGEPYSRQGVQRLWNKASFPKPWLEALGPGRPNLWREDDVVEWAHEHGFAIKRMDELED